MTKIKNQYIYSDIEHLERLVDEQENYIGRPYRLDRVNGCLVIFALPKRHKKSKPEKTDREPRNKRAESAGRRNHD